jgi:DNA-binding NarL/FixJ family response regulator
MSSLAHSHCNGSLVRGYPRDACAPPLLLFIADDHPLILESIKGVFQMFDQTAAVVGFPSIAELEATLEHCRTPDLVLIDFNMPGLASVEAVSHFLSRYPDLRVSVISGHADGQIARDVIQCGCYGFVPKSLSPSAVYHAVRLMVTGGHFIPDFLVESPCPEAASSFADDRAIAMPGRARHGLTRREIEVLRTLASGLTNKQIARELAIEEVTVKLHLRRGYSKLNVRNRIQAVRAVFEGALD